MKGRILRKLRVSNVSPSTEGQDQIMRQEKEEKAARRRGG